MSGASFFQEFTLDQSQQQSVEAAIAEMQALVAEVKAIRDELASSVTGDLTGADVARLLTARDEAVAAATSAEEISTSLSETVVIVTNAASAASGYRAGAAASEAAAVAAASTAQGNAAVAAAQAAEALTSAGNARAQADRADAFANSPPDYEIEPGKFGMPHYYERVRAAAENGTPFKVVRKTGADLDGSNRYTLSAEDLGKLLVFSVTVAAEIVCPVDLWRTVSADGSALENWVRVRLAIGSTGSVKLVSPGGTVVQQVAPIAHQVFPIASEPASAVAPGTFSFTVPAGVNRRASFQMLAAFSAAKTGRNSGLTVSGSSNLTKIQADTAEGNNNSTNPIDVAVWKADLGTSTSPTVHTLALTPDGTWLSAVLVCDAVVNSVGVVQAPTVSNLASATSGEVAIAINPAENKGMVVAVTAHLGNDAQPLTPTEPSGAVTLDNTKTPLARALKDISFATHRHPDVVTGSRIYKTTSAKVTRGSGVAVVFKPDTVTTVSTAINGFDTINIPGTSFTVMANSDGVTYHGEA